MWKKVLSIVLIIVVFIFLFFSFKTKKIKELTNVNYNSITKIMFVDGSGRNKPLTVDNKQKIEEFINYIDDCVVIKADNPDKIGWLHSASFYENDKQVMEIVFVNPIIINGEYYRVIWGGLSGDKIDKFLKSINLTWVTS
jgi:predicted lactoylglutathione lyase